MMQLRLLMLLAWVAITELTLSDRAAAARRRYNETLEELNRLRDPDHEMTDAEADGIGDLLDRADTERADAERLEDAEARMARFDATPETDEQRAARLAAQGRLPNEIEQPDFQVNGGRADEDPLDLRALTFDASPRDLQARIHTALERNDIMRDTPDHCREQLTRVLREADNEKGHVGRLSRHIITHLQPAYRDAFMLHVQGREAEWTDEQRRAVTTARAMSLTDAEGGFAVPADLDPTLVIADDGSVNPFRQIATVRRTVRDVFQKPTSTVPTLAWAGEAVEATDVSPTLARTNITPHKLHGVIPFSVEIEGDWSTFADNMRRLLGEARDNSEATAFAVGAGDGSDQPFGIVTALDANTNVELAMATNGSFADTDVYATLEALGPRYRNAASAAWVCNLAYLNRMRQFGTSNNYHGFTVDFTERGISQVLGRDLHEASAMDSALSNTAIQNALILGRWTDYYIVDRVGMSIELVRHLFDTANNLPNGQRGFYAWMRVGADTVNDEAFILLQNGSD